ncbi:hypothetical protein QJS04_geneDACA005677 [Acorus gramineus]|uniref:Uncharacterized protein n=1 Tax=Acorus gramineus TaxID=55184 RepID=A0AAV9BKA8_ACOGR|nr:hypothetical protein QJS04_geneDACA005677 [Acorus gramineus]
MRISALAYGLLLICLGAFLVGAEDPYKFFTWTITYGTISPIGVPQQGILINGQFPGPTVDVVTNDNILVNVINQIDEPILITWSGIEQRKNSWQDGVLGTNCPIPPNSNYTYKFQAKDQIGTYTYFLSTAMHRAAGGFGGFNIHQRSVISKPYPEPDGEFTLLVGDWYTTNHKDLRQSLDDGKTLPSPNALLINGRPSLSSFSGLQGKTYMFKVSNVGFTSSISFTIQGHKMKLVEVEGAHTLQNNYDTLDIHVGQSLAVLVTFDQPPRDYYIVASTRFVKPVRTATAILRYTGSNTPVSGPLPPGPPYEVHGSMVQARTIRMNLTANAARPNPQGSFHYGNITTTATLVLANSPVIINGKRRYAINGASYVSPDTPLKLADYFNIPGVFTTDTLPTQPVNNASAFVATSVVPALLHDFYEIVFQNNEKTMQTWHLDGYHFWVVGFGSGQWTPGMRNRYNLLDAIPRRTVQVYRNSWSAILVSLDNKGMWNLRSDLWERQYLGQQFYIKIWNSEKSFQTEYDIPPNALLCGKAVGRRN